MNKSWTLAPATVWMESSEAVIKCVDYLKNAEIVSIDIESSGLSNTDDVPIMFSLSDGYKRFAGMADLLRIKEMREFLESDREWTNSNIKIDAHWLANIGIILGGTWFDTVVLDWLYDENREGRHGLKECAFDYCGIKMREFKEVFPFFRTKNGVKDTARDAILRKIATKEGFEEAKQYSGLDSYANVHVYWALKKKLQGVVYFETPEGNYTAWDYFRQIEAPFTKVLWKMERRGIMISVGYLQQLQLEAEVKIKELEAKILEKVGRPINPRSAPQLRKLFYEERGKLVEKWTSGGTSGKKEPSTDESVLKKWAEDGDEIAQLLIDHRDLSKLKNTYVIGLQEAAGKDHRIHPTFKQAGTVSGRLSCTDPNLQNIPTNSNTLNIRAAFIPAPGYILRDLDYCLAPGTRILTSNLRWVPIETLKEGDELIAFDENLPGRNKGKDSGLKPSVVEKTKRLKKKCYKITTEKGELIASEDHMWIGRSGFSTSTRRWIKTKDLKVGYYLSYFCDPWEEDKTWEGGYIGGFLDGEGWINRRTLGFGQNEGPTLNFMISKLKEKNVNVGITKSKSGKHKVAKCYAKGDRAALSVIGRFRPQRLLSKSKTLWEGSRTWGGSTSKIKILNIEEIGEQEVIAVQTSTKTFIAEGYLSHNCQLELVLLAHCSGDEKMIQAIKEGKDLHIMACSLIFGYDYDWGVSVKKKEAKVTYANLTPEEKRLIDSRSAIKRTWYGVIYGIGDEKLGAQLTADFRKADPNATSKQCPGCGTVYPMDYQSEYCEHVGNYPIKNPHVSPYLKKKLGPQRGSGISKYQLEVVPRVVSDVEAKMYMSSLLNAFSKVSSYLENQRETAKTEKGVRSLLGKIRHLPHIDSANYSDVLQAQRQAQNDIQNKAAEVLKIVMLLIDQNEELETLGARMLLNIHDELLLENPITNDEKINIIVKDIMENGFGRTVYELLVPLKTDSRKGSNWAETH